jgi:hypothetical protein
MSRDKRLQKSLDIILEYGGLMGVTSAAELYGCQPANIDWHLEPWSKIDCGRVYLRADVEAAIAARDKASA